MKLNVISVCSGYTADELLRSFPRTRAQSDFLKLQWQQGSSIQDLENFLDELQRSVNENAVTVVLDGSHGFYTKTMIAEGLGLDLEEDEKSRSAVEAYCRKNGISCGGPVLDGCRLPAGAIPMNSSETEKQGFILVRGGRCIVVFPAEEKSFDQMFSNGFYPFLLKNGADTAVVQTIAIRDSKVKDVEEYLRLFKHGKNILPLLYQEDGQWNLSVTAIRGSESESRQACESLIENIEAEMGDIVLTAVSARKEKKLKKSDEISALRANDRVDEVRKPPKKSGFGFVRKILLFICICTFLGSAGYLGLRYYRSVTNLQNYESLREVYDNGGFPPIGYPLDYDPAFSGLYQINQDVAGWLSIEGTSLDYPVVQTDDNLYYHRLNFEGEKSLHGVPFVDCGVNLKAPSTNTIIYGHNIKNDDQMFNSLTHYWDPSYYIQHPVIDFHTIYGKRSYKIFGVFIANVNPDHGTVFQYHTFIDANDVSEIQEFIYNVQIRSILNTGVDVLPSDELLTLSTCTYEFENARLVVVARRLRDGESREVDASAVSKAASPLMPDIWYQLYGGTKPVLEVPTFSDALVLDLNDPSPLTEPEPVLDEPEEQLESEPVVPETPVTPVIPVATESPAPVTPTSPEPTPEPEPSMPEPELPAEEPAEEKSEENTENQTEQKQEEKEPQEEEPETEDEDIAVISSYDENDQLSVKINGKTVTDSAYDIVCMMVQAEMGTTFRAEALKAQAVAAYTYVKYNNQAGVNPAVVAKTSISANVEEAVRAVIGEAVYYNGSYANTTYCAANAGVSNNSEDVWGGSLPYLTSVKSEGDKQSTYYGYETRLSLKYVADRIEDYHNIDPYDYSDDPADWFGDYDCGAGKYVSTIEVCGRNLKGRSVREGLLQSKIRSAAFEVEYDNSREEFVFTTYGYGHGVGMSQLGANYYAGQGWDYIEILEHYYSGTQVR